MLPYLALMTAAGATVACQAPINAALSRQIGRFPALMVSFFVGAILSVIIVAVLNGRLQPSLSEAARNATRTPWWMFVGGALGLFYVLSAIIAMPHIGVASSMVATLTGQLIGAFVVDAYGLFGVDAQGFQPKKLLAMPLLALAVWLVQSK